MKESSLQLFKFIAQFGNEELSFQKADS